MMDIKTICDLFLLGILLLSCITVIVFFTMKEK